MAQDVKQNVASFLCSSLTPSGEKVSYFTSQNVLPAKKWAKGQN